MDDIDGIPLPEGFGGDGVGAAAAASDAGMETEGDAAAFTSQHQDGPAEVRMM